MNSFPWEKEIYNVKTYRDFLELHMKLRLEPTLKNHRENAFSFYKRLEKIDPIVSAEVVDAESAWSNLTLFCGQEEKQTYVGNALSRTQTDLGKVAQFLLLASPINDVERLVQRQEVIKILASDNELYTNLDQLFTSMHLPEITFLSFYGEDQLEHAVKQLATLSPDPFNNLNKSPFALFLNSCCGHLQRSTMIISVLGAVGTCAIYGVSSLTGMKPAFDKLEQWTDANMGGFSSPSRWAWDYSPTKMRALIALGSATTMGFFIKPLITQARDSFFLEECVHKITLELAQFINNARRAYELVREKPELVQCKELSGLINFFENKVLESPELKELCDLLATNTFVGEVSLLAHKGRIIRAFTLMHEVKEELIPLGASIGALDCYHSYARLIHEFEEKNVSFCFPTYLKRNNPEIEIQDFWHPLLSVDKAVPGSVTLGNGQRQNMVITGPNAGGKSTIMKAITLSIYLAQTISIVPAREMSYTPFSKIKIYLNIIDDIGAGNSLFMAEAKQAQQIIDTVEKAGPQEFTFTCFDEVFNGTSPVEGSAAAYSVATHLSRFDNCISLIATHFPLLTQLEAATDTFENYKVSVDVNSGGLAYPYKLEKGSSHQHVALEVLKEQGFDGSLLDEAQKYVDDPSLHHK